MKKRNRLTASYVRKFLPGLRRISTDEGRKWTADGTSTFDSLRDLVEYYKLLDKGYVKEGSESGGTPVLQEDVLDQWQAIHDAAHAADQADREMEGEDVSAE